MARSSRSEDSRWSPGSACPYMSSVVDARLCPRRCWATATRRSCRSSSVPAVCHRSCTRTSGSPGRRSAASRKRWTLRGLSGVHLLREQPLQLGGPQLARRQGADAPVDAARQVLVPHDGLRRPPQVAPARDVLRQQVRDRHLQGLWQCPGRPLGEDLGRHLLGCVLPLLVQVDPDALALAVGPTVVDDQIPVFSPCCLRREPRISSPSVCRPVGWRANRLAFPAGWARRAWLSDHARLRAFCSMASGTTELRNCR